MTPRQLRYFLEVAHRGNVTSAARALSIAQPALSQHIAALERELGARLFEREARGVKATAAGRRLAAHAELILRQIEEARRDVGGGADDAPSGEVAVCLAAGFARVIGPLLLARAAESHPGIVLALSTRRGPEATRALEEGAIDLALIPNAIATGSLDVMPLFEEPLLLIGRTSLIGMGRAALRTERALSLPLVYPDRSHDVRKMVDRLGLELGVTPNIRFEHNSAEIMAGLIELGLACTVMSASPFASEIASGAFATRRISPPASRIVSVAWRRDRPMNPAIRAARELIIEVVTSRMGVIGGRLLGVAGKSTVRAGRPLKK